MALKVKAKEQLIKVGKYAETYRYVMMPELYTALTQDKVIKEAALRSRARGVITGTPSTDASSAESPHNAECISIKVKKYLSSGSSSIWDR